jgi:NitT/TauT family transport system substrate-binding protein
MTRISVGIDLATLTRRQLLKGAAAASAAALLPWERAFAQTKLNFGYMKIGDLSPFFMATDKGFFKDAGLDITLASMVGGAAIQPALASGAINIGWTNVVSMCQGHLQGFDFRFLANGAIVKRGTHDFSGLMVSVDSPIRTGKDLEGKILGINTLGNVAQATAMFWVDKNGGDSSKVKWVEIPMPQMAPALVNKQIDACLAVEPFVTVPVRVQKQARLIGQPLGELAPRFLIASYFSSEAWIEKNVATVKVFVAAINRGIDAHNANPEEAKAVIAKHTGLKLELVKDIVLPAFEKKLVESDIEPLLDAAVRYKMVEKKFPPREIISKYVPA